MIQLNFQKSADGLLPAIVQEAETGRILMLAYVNQEAFDKTIETGQAHYWSRSRQSLWLKGETSGNVQHIKDILIDCDEDTIVYVVRQHGGAACHQGYPSCFYRKVEGGELHVIEQRVFDPATVYTKETATDSMPPK
jgi:phosphoribosyl-AMP cyclohydrolase